MSGPLTYDAFLFGLAPRGVYLAGHVTITAGELLPHRFTHHPDNIGAGIFSVALVVLPTIRETRELPGSLPYSVRTFLFCKSKSDHPTRFTQGQKIITKNVEQTNKP